MTDTMTAVIQAHLPELRAWARFVCRVRNQEEDLLQNTLLKAFEAWPTYDEARGKPLPWLRSIMRNEANDMGRSHVRRTSRIQAAAEELRELVECIDDEALDQVRSNQTLHTYMRELPQKQQDVLHLHFFEDLSDSAIAATLQIKLGTAKSRKRIGIEKLRAAYKLE